MNRLTIEQRKAVQFVRDAHMVKIEAFGDDGTSLRFVFENYKPFKKVIHDIAIALQDFYNNTDTPPCRETHGNGGDSKVFFDS